MAKTVWMLGKGNWAGITPRGKRFAGEPSRAAALKKAGGSRTTSSTTSSKKKGGKRTTKQNPTGNGLVDRIGTALKGFFNMGAVEHVVAGSIGGALLRNQGVEENAVPLAQVAYGASSVGLDRRGKASFKHGALMVLENTIVRMVGE